MYLTLLSVFLAITTLCSAIACVLLLRKNKRLKLTIELQQIEADLNQSTERFRGICEHSELGVVVTNPEGRFTFANDRYLGMIDATIGEVLNGQWIRHIHPDDQAEIKAHWDKALLTQQGFVTELRSILNDGSIHWAHVHTFPIRGGDDSFRGFVTTVEDVTARKVAEANLRTSEERYARVFHLLPDVLTISNLATGRYIEINDRWEALTGFTREEALGRTSQELNIWYDEDGRSALIAALHEKGEVNNYPVRFRHKDDRLVEGEVSGAIMQLDATPHLILVSHDVTQRNALARAQHEVEAALRESEQKFSRVFQLMPDLVIISNAEDGRYIDMNQQWTPMSGWSYEEAIGKTSLELNFWATPEERKNVIRRLSEEGEIRQLELFLRRKNGEMFVTEYSGRLFEINDKRYLISVITDVSEQRRIELERIRALEAQAESERKFRVVFDQAFELIGVLSLDGTLIEANQTALDFSHSAAESVLHRPFWEGPWWQHDAAHKLWLQGAISTAIKGELVRAETTHLDANGRLHTIDFSIKPVRDESGTVTTLIVEGREISALKEAEAALRSSEAKFSGAFHASLDYITISYLDTGRILEVNEAFERMTGWTREEAIGKTSIDLRIWPHQEERKSVVSILQAQGFVRDYPCKIGLKSGEQRSCLLNASTIEVGGKICFLGVVRDVTEQLETQRHIEQLNESLELRVSERTAALEESNNELADALTSLKTAQTELIRSEKLAALGSLVAGIAHELNTPIGNGVTVASSLFERTRKFSETVHGGAIKRSILNDYVEGAQTASDLLLRNLERARDLVASFKQVAIDQTSDQRRPFDLRTVIEEVISTLSPMTKKTPYRIDLILADNLTLDSYPGPLGQVITNFITNSVLHAFEGRNDGCMRISTRAIAGDQVEICFSDDGIGIPEEHQKHIFDPFFTTKLGKGGSGLGLNIVHNIVFGALGGKLDVVSNPDKGTTFTLTIPSEAPRNTMENIA